MPPATATLDQCVKWLSVRHPYLWRSSPPWVLDTSLREYWRAICKIKYIFCANWKVRNSGFQCCGGGLFVNSIPMILENQWPQSSEKRRFSQVCTLLFLPILLSFNLNIIDLLKSICHSLLVSAEIHWPLLKCLVNRKSCKMVEEDFGCGASRIRCLGLAEAGCLHPSGGLPREEHAMGLSSPHPGYGSRHPVKALFPSRSLCENWPR